MRGRTFEDGAEIRFARGSFDNWCVWYKNKEGERFPPHDKDYFQGLLTLAEDCGKDIVYNDYVKVFDATNKELILDTFSMIDEMSEKYKDSLFAKKIFSILYMTMIAEENKQFSILGKRIKRLGIHRLFYEQLTVEEATNFMRKKPWRELDEMCKERKF